MLDMGFNLDAGSLAGSSAIPASEIELRRQIYWALYSTDKFSAGYTGRACTMMVSVSAMSRASTITDLKQSFQGDVEFPSVYKSSQQALPQVPAVSRQNDNMIFLQGQAELCKINEEILFNL